MPTFELTHTDSTDPASLAGCAWIPAVVPGGVHESLMAAGTLADPYYADNETLAAWIEEKIWWYRGSLDAGEGRSDLIFHGLDSVATVYVDGVETARHETMFRPLQLSLSAGPHELLIRFDPPLAGLDAPSSVAAELTDSVFAELRPGGAQAAPSPIRANVAKTLRRKPLYGYGWDFAPHLPSIGIWQPVEVLPARDASITGVYARTVAVSVVDRTAEVVVDVETSGSGEVAI